MKESLFDLAARLRPRPEGEALVGLSGGGDSVGLLYALLPLQDAGRLRLEAVHVNHGIRGAAADGDEEFCRALCAKEGIPFHALRADLGGRTDENAAREARYACFEACLRETGMHQLILAHQRDDQAETFLMRLLRGAGPGGLGCMGPREERNGYTLLRPMLQIGGEEIRDALRAEGIAWREDETNSGDGYLRNRIRHGLLPEMERLAPGAAGRIARAAALIREEHEALTARMDGLERTELSEPADFAGRTDRKELSEPTAFAGQMDRKELSELAAFAGRVDAPGRDAAEAAGAAGERDWICVEPLRAMPAAERSERLRRWWRARGPKLAERALSQKQTEALSALVDAEAGAVANLPGGWRAERGRKHLHLLSPEAERPAPVIWNGQSAAWGGIRLTAGPSRGNPGDGRLRQEVPVGFADGCVIRCRQNGDRIRPFGMTGSRALQDYLTDRKVDRPWRDRIPLLCRGNEVLLVAGIGAGAVPNWDPEEPHICLEWEGEMPWL